MLESTKNAKKDLQHDFVMQKLRKCENGKGEKKRGGNHEKKKEKQFSLFPRVGRI